MAPLLPMTGPQAEAPAKGGDTAEPGAKKKGKAKRLVIGLVVLLAAGGGAYETVLKPKPAAATVGKDGKPVKPKLTPGAMITLDPVTTSISDGHVIQIALGLQVVSGVATDVMTADAPQADSAALEVLAGKTYKQLLSPAGRATALKQIKANVIKTVVDTKGKQQVYDVFLPTYVLQ